MTETLTNDIRQEANTALLEVDKGLHSSRIGEQCEAVVKFPALVERFPFPILINAAFLKLVDVFRTGTNLLRLNILKVMQLSERHLNKITSVDEFLRRIFSVIHSNDPVARAVTLRFMCLSWYKKRVASKDGVFGSIASIIAERKNVHHSIHHSLDSNDQVEVEAAIFATSCLCRHSGTFAAGVCEKIASMVQGLTTPVEMKLKLIPILKQMHHNISTASQVRELCLKLLPSYPSTSFTTAILNTLTELAIATLVHVYEQVKLLLSYAQSDARKVVRLMALQELYHTASKVPQMWTREMNGGLLLVVEKAVSRKEKELGFLVLLRLSKSLAVHNMESMRDTFLPYCYNSNTNIAAYAMGVVTNITIATTGGLTNQIAPDTQSHEQNQELKEIGGMLVESLIVMDFREAEEYTPLKVVLSSVVKLAATTSEVSRAAMETLLSVLPKFSGPDLAVVCKALVSIAAHAPDMWVPVTPKLMEYLNSKADVHYEVMLPILTVLMELHSGVYSAPQREHFQTSTLPTIQAHLWSLQHPSQLWVAYKVARRASMMGFHEVAEPIYHKLSRNVSAVKFRNWLSSLAQFSTAQRILASSHATSSSLIPALCNASAVIYNSMMLTKASNPPSSFPLSYLSAHAALLNAHTQLLTTCVGLHTVPPPSLGMGSSMEQKFRLCMSQFQSLAEQYSTLYSSLFDADPATLEYTSLLQQSCVLMASIISSTALSRKPLVSPAKVSTPVAETPSSVPVEVSDNFNTKYLLGIACKEALQYAQGTACSLLPINEEHASVLVECSRMILQVPFRLPQYFFVSLQQTNIKLNLSPPLPPPGQDVSVNLNTHLTLKVEGVIEHSGKTSVYRIPTAVHVRVVPSLEKILSNDVKQPELKTLERTEPVEKDYFQSQFLLNLPVRGYYTLQIDASLLDEGGTLWHTGPRTTMSVLVDTEESMRQQQKQKDSSSIQQQRPRP